MLNVDHYTLCVKGQIQPAFLILSTLLWVATLGSHFGQPVTLSHMTKTLFQRCTAQYNFNFMHLSIPNMVYWDRRGQENK